MREKVTKIIIELETVGDAYEVVDMTISTLETLLESERLPTTFKAHGNAKGIISFETSERCSECKGVGEIATDEDDGEGHIMAGVGSRKCLCQS